MFIVINYNIYNVKRFKMISLKIQVVVLPGLANVPDPDSCQSQIFINDGISIVLLDSLADPQSNWFETEFLSESLPTE
jgi:hypothetical protein